jgi:HAE1 family hydrophobic/amphiphilic exporter-1
MTQPPSYRKVNPADAPVLFIALTSPSLNLSDLNDYAEHLISPTLSTLDGVAQVNIFGQKRFAVRVRVLPDALAARNISLDELTTALRAANANTPVGTLEGPQADLDAAGQPPAAQRSRVRRPDRRTARPANRCACATWRRSRTASRR